MVRERTTATELHARDLAAGRRAVHVVEVTTPAIVLGSTQSIADVDGAAARAAGIDVVRRRSGGGAVLLAPGGQVWIDLVVPRDDPLWDDDVARASHWLGRAFVQALQEIDVVGAHEHRGAMVATELSSVVCFAGLGPGEVTVGGAKCVGISQRRTREGARFQCAIPVEWDVDLHTRLLAPGLERVGAGRSALDAVAVRTVGDGAALVDAFLEHLPNGQEGT